MSVARPPYVGGQDVKSVAILRLVSVSENWPESLFKSSSCRPNPGESNHPEGPAIRSVKAGRKAFPALTYFLIPLLYPFNAPSNFFSRSASIPRLALISSQIGLPTPLKYSSIPFSNSRTSAIATSSKYPLVPA